MQVESPTAEQTLPHQKIAASVTDEPLNVKKGKQDEESIDHANAAVAGSCTDGRSKVCLGKV